MCGVVYVSMWRVHVQVVAFNVALLLTQRERIEILEAVLANRKVPYSLNPKQQRELGRRTEGYLAWDLVAVVERSLNALEQRTAGGEEGGKREGEGRSGGGKGGGRVWVQ